MQSRHRGTKRMQMFCLCAGELQSIWSCEIGEYEVIQSADLTQAPRGQNKKAKRQAGRQLNPTYTGRIVWYYAQSSVAMETRAMVLMCAGGIELLRNLPLCGGGSTYRIYDIISSHSSTPWKCYKEEEFSPTEEGGRTKSLIDDLQEEPPTSIYPWKSPGGYGIHRPLASPKLLKGEYPTCMLTLTRVTWTRAKFPV